MRQRLLIAIYAGQSFRRALRDLGLTSNQIWGLTKTDKEWSEKLEAALTATRRHDLRDGTNAVYVGAVCVKSAESISEFAWRGIARHQFNLQPILGSRFGLRCDS